MLLVHKMCFYVNLSCEEANCSEKFGSFLACFKWVFGFFQQFCWPFLAFFEKINLATLPCREAVQMLLPTWRGQLRCDTVFMTSSLSSSLRFSLLAVIFRTTLNKITSRRFQLHLRKASFCSGISFHRFIFTYFPAFEIPNRTKQIFEFLAV